MPTRVANHIPEGIEVVYIPRMAYGYWSVPYKGDGADLINAENNRNNPTVHLSFPHLILQ